MCRERDVDVLLADEPRHPGKREPLLCQHCLGPYLARRVIRQCEQDFTKPTTVALALAPKRRPWYRRVSTRDQNLARQVDALTAAQCIKVFGEKLSGRNAERPELWDCLDYLRAGDTLVGRVFTAVATGVGIAIGHRLFDLLLPRSRRGRPEHEADHPRLNPYLAAQVSFGSSAHRAKTCTRGRRQV